MYNEKLNRNDKSFSRNYKNSQQNYSDTDSLAGSRGSDLYDKFMIVGKFMTETLQFM